MKTGAGRSGSTLFLPFSAALGKKGEKESGNKVESEEVEGGKNLRCPREKKDE